MILSVIRQPTREETTLGDLFIDGVKFCETLEDEIRPDGVKVPGQTCIPAIRYKVDVTWSPRFKRMMPILYTEDDKQTIKYKGVTFVGTRIHGGNKHTDTEGCILVAYREVDPTTIQGSAEIELTFKIMTALGYDPTWNRERKSWIKGTAQRPGEEVWCDVVNLGISGTGLSTDILK